jgi:hypothetical protein
MPKPILSLPGPRVRIRLKPENRRTRQQYYAKNSDGMHWTEFREIAEDFSVSLANQLARRIAQTHANLRDRIEIVPI